jgi:hypothetical protein
MSDLKQGEEEYFIDFNTKINPGKIQAVRVRIDLVTVTDMDKPMSVNLSEHPLYPELKRYVESNTN